MPISASATSKTKKTKIVNPIAFSLSPEQLQSFMNELNGTFGNTLKILLLSHATFQDCSEVRAWKIEGIRKGKFEQLLLETYYIDFHYFGLSTLLSGQEMPEKLNEGLMFSAPDFPVLIKDSKVLCSMELFESLFQQSPFLFEDKSSHPLQDAWRLYSSCRFNEAFSRISAFIKSSKSPRIRVFCVLWAAEIARKSNKIKFATKLYQEAADLFGLMGLTWFSYFSLMRLMSLEGATERKQETLSRKPESNLPPGIGGPSLSFDYSWFKMSLERVLSAKTKDEKKKSFENLANFMLGSIDPSISVWQNVLTATEEIDLLLKNEANDPFWLRLGSPILVECKYWKKPIGTSVLRDFKGKLDSHGIKTGILLAYSGITGNEWRAAKLYLKELKASGYHIIYLDKDDLDEIAKGATPSQKIIEKYYWLFTI
jgi:hypothetical protein